MCFSRSEPVNLLIIGRVTLLGLCTRSLTPVAGGLSDPAFSRFTLHLIKVSAR